MKKRLTVLSIFLALSTPVVFADQYLIQEMESLEDSLDKNDPDRTELSLRLADLYFDISIQESERSDIMADRNKAYELYSAVLAGKDGLIVPDKKKSLLIKYQMGRVLNKLGRFDEAYTFYKEVHESPLVSKKLKRESAFALAEYFEEKVNFNKANHYYLSAISLCETKESCNFSHYKRAWLLYKEIKIEDAISELKLSLWDSKGQVRDKIVNDLLLFFSANTTNGEAELAFIRELENKTGKTDLVRKLVESFYSAGNRIAGSFVLEELNRAKPDPFYEMRLLEEFYGFRDWDRVDKYLNSISLRRATELPKDKEEAAEFKAMLKRMIVQFDSEASQDRRFASYLLKSIDQFLVFYPNDDMRKKMQQGWLKYQVDKDKKIDRLAIWIKQAKHFAETSEQIRKLRQSRLALAQQQKNSKVILEESLAIAEILKGTKESREFSYIAAHEYYKNKQYDHALKLFIPLANISDLISVDKWAILAQNLTLDIYNIKNDYKSLSAQAALWLKLDPSNISKETANELAAMKLLKKQSDFENIVAMGETSEALEKFYYNCFHNIYIEKSCQNAKVLAVKLSDQSKLVSILESSPVKKLRDEKALMAEYELMGRFKDAAKLQEKYYLNRNAEIPVFLKIALLFELDQDFQNRDRILRKLISKIRRYKSIDPKYEAAIYLTLDEANLLNERTLLLPWKLDRKLTLARRLSQTGSNSKIDNLLMSQESYQGPRWSQIVLDRIQKQFKHVGKIKFYGRRSERRFKKRVASLERLVRFSDPYLKSADSRTRVYILEMLKQAYMDLSVEILSTPLPDGLTEEVMMKVQTQLATMAAPYNEVSIKYEKLQTAELSTMSVNEHEQVKANLALSDRNYSDFIELEHEESINISNFDFTEIETSRKNLLKNPSSVADLKMLEKFYVANNSKRIAAYFTGRLNSIKE